MRHDLKKPVVQADGTPLQARAPRVGSEIVIGSHNFCDKTTWFGDSTRVTDQAMEAKGGEGGLIWKSTNSDHINWIDLRTGRMHNQEKWTAEFEHGYVIEVKVDGVVKVHCPSFIFDSGEGAYDYWVDYDAGEVHFFSDQTGSTITASFSHATTSTFYVTPSIGKVLRIEDAEADFSSDMVLETSFNYTVRGYVDVFAPQMVKGTGTEHDPVLDKDLADPPSSPDTGDRYIVADSATGDWSGHEKDIAEWGGSSWSFTTPQEEEWTTVIDEMMYYTYRGAGWILTLPSGTKIPLQEDSYHRVTQIITEARGALPSVDAIGATAEHQAISDIKEFRRKSRGMKHNVQAVPFNYATSRDLYSGYGMDLLVTTTNHSEVGGEMLTLTFYCTSQDES